LDNRLAINQSINQSSNQTLNHSINPSKVLYNKSRLVTINSSLSQTEMLALGKKTEMWHKDNLRGWDDFIGNWQKQNQLGNWGLSLSA
jgi:hypothetical protein